MLAIIMIMNDNKLRVFAIGLEGCGKSTLLNCLLGPLGLTTPPAFGRTSSDFTKHETDTFDLIEVQSGISAYELEEELNDNSVALFIRQHGTTRAGDFYVMVGRMLRVLRKKNARCVIVNNESNGKRDGLVILGLAEIDVRHFPIFVENPYASLRVAALQSFIWPDVERESWSERSKTGKPLEMFLRSVRADKSAEFNWMLSTMYDDELDEYGPSILDMCVKHDRVVYARQLFKYGMKLSPESFEKCMGENIGFVNKIFSATPYWRFPSRCFRDKGILIDNKQWRGHPAMLSEVSGKSGQSLPTPVIDNYIDHWFQRIRHPHILRVYDFGGSGNENRVWMAFERADHIGPWLNTNSLESRLEWCIELCKAVDYIHCRGRVIGNLSDKSIWLRNGETLVLKFSDILRHVNTTSPGRFDAVEVFVKSDIEWRVMDYYSLSAVMVYLLTGGMELFEEYGEDMSIALRTAKRDAQLTRQDLLPVLAFDELDRIFPHDTGTISKDLILNLKSGFSSDPSFRPDVRNQLAHLSRYLDYLTARSHAK